MRDEKGEKEKEDERSKANLLEREDQTLNLFSFCRSNILE